MAPDTGFRLIESLRWDGALHRVDAHLRRMGRSAERFGRPFDGEEARRRLSEQVAGLPASPPRKVRLTLGPEGDLDVEAVELARLPDPVPTLLTGVRVDPDDDFLRHKTDRRGPYREARRRARERGSAEGLLLNARGEVTEGSFTSLFVRSGDAWLTPPVSCGLLPGVFRAELLDRLDGARERVLRPGDVAGADEVWLCNSVRGAMRAEVTVDEG